MRRVCLVGAGFISHVHAEALRSVPGVSLHAIVDPNSDAARSVATKWAIPKIFASIEEALTAGEIDCAHVLTPPDLHAATALPFLNAGVPVLLEKPLAVTTAECDSLNLAAAEHGAVLGVNQNFVFHPAFARLRQAIAQRRLGRPVSIGCVYNMPLRQIAARQFGHWMFYEPGNILLEQAVHPLSQIVALAGKIERFTALAGSAIEISPGVPFYGSVSLSLQGARLPADLRMAVGQSFPLWQIAVICDDGVAVADIANNRFFTGARGAALEAFDSSFSGARTGFAIVRESLRTARDFTLSTVKLKGRSDAFFTSFKASLGVFHKSLDAGTPPEIGGDFGAHLVSVCEEVARTAFTAQVSSARLNTQGDYDVALLGGTGFIGAHVLRRLLADGRRVGVMARNVRNLPRDFFDDRVVILRGDVRRREDVERAIGNASLVVNLAHGGGGSSYEQVRDAMVGSAEIVARACLDKKVRRLIHVGSIASLYLGPGNGRITGATPPDPKAVLRADYARAKADCDLMLLALHKTDSVPVCILRPGLVIGEGGTPLHGGLGFFNNEQHCIGWNGGRNALPFVLAGDVADAIVGACDASGVEGRAYNLVGDVRLSAREYVRELAQALSRPLRFHPQWTTKLWLEEMGKWIIKRATGRKSPRPTLRDLLSRGLKAEFDCSDAKRDLHWTPVSERAEFVARGVQVFATHE